MKIIFQVIFDLLQSFVVFLFQNVHAYKTGPKGKSPWIEYNGEVVGDSQFIMSYLSEKLEVDLNKTLSKEHKATARAFQKMVDEYMYWSVFMLFSVL